MKTATTALVALAAWILLLVPFAGCDSDGDDATDADADTDADGDTDTELDCEGGRLDPATGLCWQNPADDMSAQSLALDYCDELVIVGHDDWVLPSREDFVTLLGGCDQDAQDGLDGYCNSCQESVACSSAFGPDQERYWTSSSEEEQSDYVWMVDFEEGKLFLHDPGDLFLGSVRCVRSTL